MMMMMMKEASQLQQEHSRKKKFVCQASRVARFGSSGDTEI